MELADHFANSSDTAGLENHKDARLELTQSALLKRKTAEWIEILDAHDVPCAPVLTRREVIRHAQVEANKILVQTDHPHAGKLRQPRTAAQFEGTPAQHRLGAPLHGEHSREILSQLGYADATITEMVEAGTVVAGEPSLQLANHRLSGRPFRCKY